MSPQKRFILTVFECLVVLGILILLTVVSPPRSMNVFLWGLFSLLVAFTMTFGIPLGGGYVSLLPMTLVAAYLVVGLAPAGWIALIGSVINGGLRYHFAEALDLRKERSLQAAIGLALANIAMQAASILVGGAVYQAIGGDIPPDFGWLSLFQILVLCLVYLSVNYLMAGVIIATRGQAILLNYLQSLPTVFVYEALPMVFAPLMVMVYTDLGMVMFVLLVLVFVIASLIARTLAKASTRLERRVKELGSLQAVGQALNASLDLDTVLLAIHQQVSALMPANNFYVALYNEEDDVVSFPLAIEDGKRVIWHSRKAGSGLSEHVLRTGKSRLIREDVRSELERIGVAMIGRVAESWLGVPLLAELKPFGLIAVQAYDTPGVFDTSHERILTMIAAQAAVVIQNSRLYTQTDEALARRVQELGSVLRTTGEGILLLDLDRRVLAVNRALANFVGVSPTELDGCTLDVPFTTGEPALITRIGYTSDSLEEEFQALLKGDMDVQKHTCVLSGPPVRMVECSLAPVRDRLNAVTGWLMVFRDKTEELQLERLREDMMHMLVHDLRSPLTSLLGGIDLLAMILGESGTDDVVEILGLAQQGGQRMLGMVNELLDINQLENGRMPLHRSATSIPKMLADIAAQLSPLSTEAQITVEVITPPDLPEIHIDKEKIRRVYANLLDNAIKFTPNGGRVQLWARVDRDWATPSMLIGVTDTGPGITPEDQKNLFKKFQRVSSIEGRRAGTGLGLSYCKLAVEAHAGQIWIESEKGKGSTFISRLPLG